MSVHAAKYGWKQMITRLFLFFAILSPLCAQQGGKELYQLYCAACHGNDGVGPEGNVNPPLARSEWLQGGPERAISAVLNGLTGPIEVRGAMYNLQMPPQGAVLSDEQLAAIMTYIRSSWGNRGKAVDAKTVAAVREKTKDRKSPWTARELSTAYPIPWRKKYIHLKDLIAHVYHGKWETMPDFSQLEAVSVEEEQRNLVDIAHADRSTEVGIVWTGILHTNREADFNARLSASDGARLFIDGKLIVEVEGVGQMNPERSRRKRFRLTKGDHDFRLEYFSREAENPALVLQMAGPNGGAYLSESRLGIKDTNPPIPLKPTGSDAVIYRNFISGARPNAIGVGYPGGMNQAFSATHLGPDLLWKGEFIDAGRHWTNRGQGYQKPSGEAVTQLLTQPAYASLESDAAAWPSRDSQTLETNFKGYELLENGIPSFKYTIGDVLVSDVFKPSQNGLERELTFDHRRPAPAALHMLLGGAKGLKTDAGSVHFPTGLKISGADSLLTKKTRDGDLAILPLPLDSPEGITKITLSYSFE